MEFVTYDNPRDRGYAEWLETNPGDGPYFDLTYWFDPQVECYYMFTIWMETDATCPQNWYPAW